MALLRTNTGWPVALATVVLQAQGPLLVRSPYLQNVGSDRATILWATREPGMGSVAYSAGGITQTVRAVQRRLPDSLTGLSFPYYQHQADLTYLRPGTEYSFRVLYEDRSLLSDDTLRFRTASPGPFTFLAFGDSGTGSREQRALAQLMFRERPALVLHVGDLAYPTGTFQALSARYLDIYQDLMKRVPFFATPGNHEYEAENGAAYFAIHAPPADGVPLSDRGRYYSFDWGDVHFTSVDTNLPLVQAIQGSGQMLRWLEEDLARTRQPWRVIFLQHPAHPTSNHEFGPANALVRRHVVPIVDRYNVQLVLAGDEHNYQVTKPLRGGQIVEPAAGTIHVITGGGGAPLYPVVPRSFLAYAESAHHYLRIEADGPRLTVRAIRIDGLEIDAFVLQLPSAPPPPPPLVPPVTSVTVEAVVNAASFAPALAPGSLVSIFGKSLARAEGRAARLPLPQELAGTVVTLNGRPLPLLYVSSTQINASFRFHREGAATLRVITPDGASQVPVQIVDAAPAIFQVGQVPAIVHTDGTLVSAGSPAAPGEALCLYVTGLGRPDTDIPAGFAAPAAPLVFARGPVEVELAGRSISPFFAGLSPGFTGLYQVNFTVPPTLATGTPTLRLLVRGAASNSVPLIVQAR